MRRPTNKAERLTLRQLYIPKNSRLVAGPAGGAVYTYESEKGTCYAVAFRGSAARSEWHHSYKNAEQRAEHVAAFHRSLQQSADYRAKKAAEKRAWVNTAKVGDILNTSWGYDQTNVDFFVVTKVSGKRVWVREIAADIEQTGFMSGKTWPAMPIRFVGEETMHTAQMNGEQGYCLVIKGHHASVETGREHYCSWYA